MIDNRNLAYWNDQTHQWQVNHGNYLIQVGISSADIKQQIELAY